MDFLVKRVQRLAAVVGSPDPAGPNQPFGFRVVDRSVKILFDSRTELWEFASGSFALGLGLWLAAFSNVDNSTIHVQAQASLKFLAKTTVFGYAFQPTSVAGCLIALIGLNALLALFDDRLGFRRKFGVAALAVHWSSVWYGIGPMGDVRHPLVPVFFLAACLTWHTLLRIVWASRVQDHMKPPAKVGRPLAGPALA